ncbi:hypothetical protein D3C73_1539440 [compost metagenome]
MKPWQHLRGRLIRLVAKAGLSGFYWRLGDGLEKCRQTLLSVRGCGSIFNVVDLITVVLYAVAVRH